MRPDNWKNISGRKFFKRLTLWNLVGRNIFISSIKDGDTIIENQEAIPKSFVQFYRNLYTKTPILGIKRWIRPDKERYFTEEEVLQALNFMNGDKAPSPDGFTIPFFQKFWSVVRGDIMNFFHYFHARSLEVRLKKFSMLLLLFLFPRKLMLLNWKISGL